MHDEGRYADCVMHKGQEATEFICSYFRQRKVLLIAGAGFDPRACAVLRTLVESGASVSLFLLREERPSPSTRLLQLAEENVEVMRTLVPDLEIREFPIFDADGAVVGGRRATAAVNEIAFEDYSDCAVDMSALSIGISFPIISLLVQRVIAEASARNVHVTVAHDPSIDAAITSTSGDRPNWVHGFSGALGLDRDEALAKLWMPQLAFDAHQALRRIYDFVDPDDTCPILPFPAKDPRMADQLAVAFQTELLSTWDVDVKNIVYADEDDPLDVYRTILRIDDLRRPVFEGSGGSSIIVSPTGSKLTALGSLMASMERDLPVAYLEAEGYEVHDDVPTVEAHHDIVHLWLEGDAYPKNRPALRREV